MGLNKTKGNMYSFITHTWNPIKGKCFHDCIYCYMKKWKGKKKSEIYASGKPPRLDEKEFKADLGSGNYIFVVSGTDMWGDWIPENRISRILAYNRLFPENTYLYQTKNTGRFHYYQSQFPEKTILCTTVETNCFYEKIMGNTILPYERLQALMFLKENHNYKTMITIEPILKFHDYFIELIKMCNPDFINIGADSQGHNLPEPAPEKVKELIIALREAGYKVHLKSNLNRLLRKETR